MGILEAAVNGSTEMTLVIFVSTLTIIIVFLPMIFVGKSMALMYGGVAWTVTYSLSVSFFVALMVVPLLCIKMEYSGHEKTKKVEKSDILKPIYAIQQRAILYVLRRRFLFLSLAFVLFAGAIFLYNIMGKEYLGSTEQDKFTIFIELPTGAKLDASDEIVREIEKVLKEYPEVKEFTSRVEGWSSKIYVNLVEISKRKKSVADVIESLRPKVTKYKPAFIYFEEEQEVGTKEIILNVYGYDYDVLREIAIAMTTRMSQIPYFADTKIRMREGRPELWLRVNKLKAGVFGFTTKEVADMVHAGVRGVRATMFHTKANEVETIARFQEKDRRTVKDIHNLLVTKRGDNQVKIDQTVNFEYGLGPSEIWRMNRSRMIQVSANIGQIPLGQAVQIVDQKFSDLKLPENYYYEVGGDYETLMQTQKDFNLTIAIIFILIYLVLAASFESYKQPFIIMITVPLAMVGAIGSLYIAGISIGMGALIGMMMLAGIVVSNGIILIDHANLLKKKHKNTFRVILFAARDRLRPVLMTKATAIFGLVPMAFDRSEGSNLWRPLAIAVIGGLLFATTLTLVMVPCVFSIFEQMRSIYSKNLAPRVIKRRVSTFFRKLFGFFTRFSKEDF
ncbi:MAG: efflux RND transporter permease subunit [Candidatus Omnitrophica bacterium]|nr:efflux RND transporter permease subunit [Candidatus Omnitrophota bacterium]